MMWLSQQTAQQTSNGRSFLKAQFQPGPATATILHLALPGAERRLGALPALFGPAVAGWLALVLLPGMIVALAFAGGPLHWSPAAAALIGLASAALLVLVTVGRFADRQLDRLAATVLDKGMGLMTGMAASGARPDGKPVPGLTQWLHETVQSLAGRGGGKAAEPHAASIWCWCAPIPTTCNR